MEKLLTLFSKNLLFVLAGVVVFEIGFLGQDLFLGRKISVQEYADNVIEKCSGEKYRPGCYDEEIPKLMERISMEDAFRVARVVQDSEGDGYLYCHVLGHNLSARETAKDPAKWKEVIARCPSGMCSNGCIHGSFQERFRVEELSNEDIDKLLPEIEEVCEAKPNWEPTGLEQASCYHAVGHLIMYISGGDINKSNQACEKIALKKDGRNFLNVCYDGNFMQIFQPLEPEDFDLVRDIAPKTKEEAWVFCSKYSGAKRNSCWQESWPLSLDEVQTPTGLVRFCSFINVPEEQTRCYNALFYVLTAQFKLNEIKMRDFCSELTASRRGLCFANAASRMIETDYRLVDKALYLCSAAENSGLGEECFEEMILYSRFNYHPGSLEAKNLCDSLPEPWNKKCNERISNY